MDVLLTSPLARAAALLVVLALTSLAWFLTARRSGRMRAVVPRGDSSAGRPTFDLTTVGATPGRDATFVQFSSAVCSPCRHVARVLTQLSAETDDVAHVEIDVTDHPELVRTHGVLRTPTVLLLGADGRIHARTSGPMTAAQARAALAGLTPTTTSKDRS